MRAYKASIKTLFSWEDCKEIFLNLDDIEESNIFIFKSSVKFKPGGRYELVLLLD